MSALSWPKDVAVDLSRALGSALYRCGRGMRQNLLIQAVAILTVALMLLLCGALRLFGLNAQSLLDSVGRSVEMIVYLSDGVTPARAAQIGEVLARLPGVARVQEVSPQQAHDRLRKSLGDRSDLLDGIEEELLPRSIEVSFRAGVGDILRVHPIYARLRNTEGVEDVELMTDWVRRLSQVRRLLLWLSLSLYLLAGLCCLYVVLATIRLGVYARRDEIEVLKLVGATRLHVAAPYLIEGAFQGLCGAALALGLLYALHGLAAPPAQALLQELAGAEAALRFLPPHEVVGGLLLSGALGLLGSVLAVRRHVQV